jgi:hypothetical protein
MEGSVGTWNGVDEVAEKNPYPTGNRIAVAQISIDSPNWTVRWSLQALVEVYGSKYFLRRRVSFASLTAFYSKIVIQKSFDKMFTILLTSGFHRSGLQINKELKENGPHRRFNTNDPQEEGFINKCGLTHLSRFKGCQKVLTCCRVHHYLQLQWKWNGITGMRGGRTWTLSVTCTSPHVRTRNWHWSTYKD